MNFRHTLQHQRFAGQHELDPFVPSAEAPTFMCIITLICNVHTSECINCFFDLQTSMDKNYEGFFSN